MDGSSKTNNGKRVEWTGAGGDHYLGIVIDQHDRVIDEFWGTEHEIGGWLKTDCADLPQAWVPMAYTPGEGRVLPPSGPPPLPGRKRRRAKTVPA